MNKNSPPRLDFVCVGPQKTGTTWLDGVLRLHPHACLPSPVKETFYFDEKYEKGEAWYWKHFEHAGPESRLFGEVGPSYFDVAEARERLLRQNPELKVIVILRDPVERAYSLYCHHYLRGRLQGGILESARIMPRLIDSGRYRHHIEAWAKAFGADRILLLKQQDIQSRPEAVLEVVNGFLGLQAVAVDQRHLDSASNEKLTPPSLGVSVALYKVSSLLRKLGLHRVVNYIKGTALVQFVMYGGKESAPPLDAATELELRRIFEAEYRYLDSLDFPEAGKVLAESGLPRT